MPHSCSPKASTVGLTSCATIDAILHLTATQPRLLPGPFPDRNPRNKKWAKPTTDTRPGFHKTQCVVCPARTTQSMRRLLRERVTTATIVPDQAYLRRCLADPKVGSGGRFESRPSGYEPDELPDCSTPHQISITPRLTFFAQFRTPSSRGPAL